LAWAVTIHKSQGKTFDRVVLDIGNGTFSPGQLYVALSRCTSFEGIVLKQPILRRHIWTDRTVVDFMNSFQEKSEVVIE
jgi:ATP-dependent exoDNAse (exonuclease V) alpha subunit